MNHQKPKRNFKVITCLSLQNFVVILEFLLILAEILSPSKAHIRKTCTSSMYRFCYTEKRRQELRSNHHSAGITILPGRAAHHSTKNRRKIVKTNRIFRDFFENKTTYFFFHNRMILYSRKQQTQCITLKVQIRYRRCRHVCCQIRHFSLQLSKCWKTNTCK